MSEPRVGHVNSDHLWFGANQGADAAFRDFKESGLSESTVVAVVKKSDHDALAEKLKAAEAEIEELKLLNHPVMADLQLQELIEKERDAFGEKLKAAEAEVAHWKAARQSAVEAGDLMKAELTRERECNKVLREALEKALEKEKEVRDGRGGSTCNKNS